MDPDKEAMDPNKKAMDPDKEDSDRDEDRPEKMDKSFLEMGPAIHNDSRDPPPSIQR
jgi:hypothetical protein